MNKRNYAWIFLAPVLIAILLFKIIPIILSFILAFGDYNGLTGFTFEGLDNFKRLLQDPYFTMALKNAAILLLFSIPLEIGLALFLANLLNKKYVKNKGFFRTTYYLPVVTSAVAISFLFGQFLAPTGLFNNIIVAIGGQPVPWLEDATLARMCMILIGVWKGLGYYITLYLAGMQSISSELYEAAEIDGASSFKQFTSITIPSIKPIIFFTVVMATIGGLNAFDIPNILFGGAQGPEQVALLPGVYLYKEIMVSPDYGYASAVAWVIAVISIAIAWVQFKVGDNGEV